METHAPPALAGSANVARPLKVTQAANAPIKKQEELAPFLQTVLYLLLVFAFRLRESFRRFYNFLRPRTAERNGAPAHVALAGEVGNDGDAVARLALAAELAGAARFSVCARSAVAIEKACARIGLRIPLRVIAPSPRASLVRAARLLAVLPPASRDCSVFDVPSVVRWLDEFHWANALDTEPDVLVVVPARNRGTEAVCFASFSVWQLRLTQFRFAECPIARLDDDVFLEMVCSATNVAKRFGR